MPETAAKPSKRATTAPKPKAKGSVAAQPAKAPEATKRASKYTPQLVAEIFARISTGEPLLQICRDENMPTRQAVYDWVWRDESVALQFARAREQGCDAMAEEALVIANTPFTGLKKVYSSGGDTTVTVTEEDMLGHRKLQIETRLKLLACWNPKKYGTNVQMGGDPGNPLVIDAASEAKELLAALLVNIELTKQAKVHA